MTLKDAIREAQDVLDREDAGLADAELLAIAKLCFVANTILSLADGSEPDAP